MRLIILFIFISLNTFAQRDLSLGVGESKTIEGGEYNITMAENSFLNIKGYVTITSLNQFKDANINVDKDAVVYVESSVNMKGGANLFVFGKLTATNVEVHGGFNAINVQGELQSHSNFILNDNTSEIQVCGKIEVLNVTNWNPQTKEKQIVLCNCGVWKTHRLNSHTKNIVTGVGSVYYEEGNIKEVLSTSSTVVINKNCQEALPVEIVSFDVKYNEIGQKEYSLEVTEESTVRAIHIMESEDGINWKEVIKREVFMEDKKSTKYSGIIK